MAEHHSYPPDPWEYVARLLAQALDVDALPHERRVACEELAGLGTEVLDGLGLEGGWREVMACLQSCVGDEDRAVGSVDAPRPTAPRTRCAEMTRYHREIRQLVNDDFAAPPMAIRRIPTLTAPVVERLALLSDCVSVQGSDDPGLLARRQAWGGLLPSTGLQALAARFPDQGAVWAAYLREVLRGAGTLGLPWRLAGYVTAVVRARPTAVGPMVRALECLEDVAGRVRWDPEEQGAMQYRHHEMQVVVARAVRQAELLDAECVAALDLAGAVLLMRAASTRDLARAWAAGRGDGEAVASALMVVDMAGELQGEQALRVLFRAAAPRWLNALSASDRDALSLARTMRERPPGAERALLLDPHPDPQLDLRLEDAP